MVHTNFFVDYPRLVAPNTKYVGGMHIRDEPIAPLASKFAQFIESADDGVILFSLGYTGNHISQVQCSCLHHLIFRV